MVASSSLLLAVLTPTGLGYAQATLSASARTAAVTTHTAADLAAAVTRRAPAAKRSAAVRPDSLPGSPGTPQASSVLYSEDFENRGSVPVRLTNYAGATGENYTADPAWLQNCNGWVAQFNDPGGSSNAVKAQVADCQPKPGGPGATGVVAWNNVRTLAKALGVLNGSADPNVNHAVSAYTNGPVNNGNPGAGKVEFQTVQPIPVTANGRFLTFSVNAAEVNCAVNSNHALLDFFLVNGAASIPVNGAPIDPCSTGGTEITPGIIAGTFTGNAPVLFTGTSLGIRLINAQGSGVGNDHAFDDIRLLDVTPQLDKSFNPATAQVGGTSTLTFTITNTADLLAKTGWSFTDTLPAGLTLATPSAAATTCPAGTVTAADGGSSVSLAGGALSAGQASCTVTVNVTSATRGPSPTTRRTSPRPPASTRPAAPP